MSEQEETTKNGSLLYFPWEVMCSRCKGWGRCDEWGEPTQRSQYGGHPGDYNCSLCKGTGAKVSEAGDDLLDFLKRHLKVSSDLG
jgi:hypothetical protein